MFAISNRLCIGEKKKSTVVTPTSNTTQGQSGHKNKKKRVQRNNKKKYTFFSTQLFRSFFFSWVWSRWPWIVTFDGFNTSTTMCSKPNSYPTRVGEILRTSQTPYILRGFLGWLEEPFIQMKKRTEKGPPLRKGESPAGFYDRGSTFGQTKNPFDGAP